MQIGIDSFAAVVSDPKTGKTLSPAERVRNLIEEIELADQVGLDTFGIGEHHRAEYLDSAPIIGGQPARFRPLIELYRQAGAKAGYKPEQLKVGAHLFGFVGDTPEQAADDFYPGYERMFTKIGAERGWGRVSRAQFNATMGPEGAYVIGDPARVTEKLLHIKETLGGLDRVTFQMTNVLLPHAKMKHAIELLGTQVAPRVRRA